MLHHFPRKYDPPAFVCGENESFVHIVSIGKTATAVTKNAHHFHLKKHAILPNFSPISNVFVHLYPDLPPPFVPLQTHIPCHEASPSKIVCL